MCITGSYAPCPWPDGVTHRNGSAPASHRRDLLYLMAQHDTEESARYHTKLDRRKATTATRLSDEQAAGVLTLGAAALEPGPACLREGASTPRARDGLDDEPPAGDLKPKFFKVPGQGHAAQVLQGTWPERRARTAAGCSVPSRRYLERGVAAILPLRGPWTEALVGTPWTEALAAM
ncbi:hypothetical protein FDECE_16918 [Fusarium decemcellulare]|nr:hypothetical protein FDECE_16918 [Fusarium decemcellulare]